MRSQHIASNLPMLPGCRDDYNALWPALWLSACARVQDLLQRLSNNWGPWSRVPRSSGRGRAGGLQSPQYRCPWWKSRDVPTCWRSSSQLFADATLEQSRCSSGEMGHALQAVQRFFGCVCCNQGMGGGGQGSGLCESLCSQWAFAGQLDPSNWLWNCPEDEPNRNFSSSVDGVTLLGRRHDGMQRCPGWVPGSTKHFTRFSSMVLCLLTVPSRWWSWGCWSHHSRTAETGPLRCCGETCRLLLWNGSGSHFTCRNLQPLVVFWVCLRWF